MTPNEMAQYIFANLDPEDTAEFASALREQIENGYTSEVQEIIADQLETVGITIVGIKCKAHPA